MDQQGCWCNGELPIGEYMIQAFVHLGRLQTSLLVYDVGGVDGVVVGDV